jgi:hypothetical protein
MKNHHEVSETMLGREVEFEANEWFAYAKFASPTKNPRLLLQQIAMGAGQDNPGVVIARVRYSKSTAMPSWWPNGSVESTQIDYRGDELSPRTIIMQSDDQGNLYASWDLMN